MESKTLEQKISILGLNQKAESYLAQGKLNEADTTCNEALVKLEYIALIYNTKGKVVEAMGNRKSAEEYYQKAIVINPNFSQAYFNLANLYFQQKQWDLATVNYQNAIKFNPDFHWYYQKLGTALMQLKQWNEASIAYQKAIDLNPDQYFYYLNLWEVLSKTKKWEESVVTYQEALAKNPDAYWYYYQLGYALHKQELIDEAITYYQKAHNLKPDLAWVNNDLADALLEKGNVHEAIPLYIRAIQLKPDLFKAYDRLKDIHSYQLVELDQNTLNKIIKCYQEAIKIKPEMDQHYRNLANILVQQGKLEEATGYYQKVLSIKLARSHPEFIKKYGGLTELGEPNFMIIGTTKSGTSSLYYYLTRHPSILTAVDKELNFFTLNFHKGIDWYLSQFAPIPKQKKFWIGEATSDYIYSEGVASKVFSYFPTIKLIVILRNPIDRAVSHYYMVKKNGSEKKSFEEKIAVERKILLEMKNKSQINVDFLRSIQPRYLSLGLYWYFIQEWMNIFPKEQFLILKSENMYKNPAATTKKVFDFLGLPNYQLLEYKHYFPGSYPPINVDLRCQLSELFQLYNQKLEEYLGIKFNWK